jgi:hypothetical protein
MGIFPDAQVLGLIIACCESCNFWPSRKELMRYRNLPNFADRETEENVVTAVIRLVVFESDRAGDPDDEARWSAEVDAVGINSLDRA